MIDRRGRRRIDPVEGFRIDAGSVKTKESIGQIGPFSGWCPTFRPSSKLAFGIKPDAPPGADSTRPTGTLHRAGAVDGFGHQTADLPLRIESIDPSKPGIDDRGHPWDGDGGLGDVRGDHDATRPVLGHRPILNRALKSPMKRNQIDAAGEPTTCLDGPINLPSSRHENQDVAIVGRLFKDSTNRLRSEIPA